MRHLSIIFLLWVEILFSFSVFGQESLLPFRFALVTDTHLKQSDRQNAETLRLAVKDINSQKDLDFVIVAGDIADMGDRTSLSQAKQLLDSLNTPYYAIPGNHDTRYCKTTTSAFDSVFVRHHFSFTHKGYFFIGFNTGQGNGNNRGGVSEAELVWIKQQLHENSGKPAIAVTHFPIVSVQVDDSANIVGALLKYNVKAILGGHYHRNAAFNYANGVPGILTRTLQRNQTGRSGYSIFEIGDHIRVLERDPAKAASFQWLDIPLKHEQPVHSE